MSDKIYAKSGAARQENKPDKIRQIVRKDKNEKDNRLYFG